MSEFSNSSRPGASSTGYVAAVLALVGERDPLEVLRESPGALAQVVRTHPAGVLARPEAPGKWSAAGVLQHLADAEVAWGWRIRQALTGERPRLEGYDQDAWARRFDYARADAGAAVELFSAVRASNLRLVEGLGPEDLARVAVHAERGEESVARMLRLNAGHDLVHRAQLERVLNSARSNPAPGSP
jgi:uncharacterized damage-inducible protein DinB